MTSTIIGDYAEACAVLANHSYQVPPAPAPVDGETDSLTWLRASVARFCEGPVHDRRRALAENDLARMDSARLREAAARMTTAELAHHGSEQVDVMRLARRVPLAVLAAELGATKDATDDVVDAAITASAGYLNPDSARSGTDEAVALLVRELGPGDSEETAHRISLLMQACDATAGLIGNALARALSSSTGPATGAPAAADPSPQRADDISSHEVDEIIAATVREDPPVRRTRRLRPDGEVVLVDITAQTFGSGRRPCPAPDHASALAAGVVGAVLETCVLADPRIDYPEAGNLRIPTSLMVAARQEPR